VAQVVAADLPIDARGLQPLAPLLGHALIAIPALLVRPEDALWVLDPFRRHELLADGIERQAKLRIPEALEQLFRRNLNTDSEST
jgi:hypothetical protein